MNLRMSPLKRDEIQEEETLQQALDLVKTKRELGRACLSVGQYLVGVGLRLLDGERK